MPKRQRISEEIPGPSIPGASKIPTSSSQTSDGYAKAVLYEIFAGCAKLSQQMNLVGFESIPVDSSYNKHVPLVPVFVLDLTGQHAQLCLKQHIAATKPVAIHLALPCGTGSRAREKPLPRALVNQGAKTPQPLRDSSHVLGLPGLHPKDQKKSGIRKHIGCLCR